jgi:predicted DsbA family dithiol-disulfide isomerase
MVKLDILSDPICPWCFIGKALLDRALAERPDHPFTIEWHPFQLNPDMPAGGMDRRAYLEAKFGGKEQAVKAYMPVHEAAEKAGLTLDLGGIRRTPNTLNAHRLIHWAGIEGKQQAVVSFLFDAYFRQGKDIGDTGVLVEIAERAEMDGAAIRRLLEGDADAEDIRARDAHARERGVNGVPTFIVANHHVLTGAQPTELWLQVIDEITQQLKGGAE